MKSQDFSDTIKKLNTILTEEADNSTMENSELKKGAAKLALATGLVAGIGGVGIMLD